MWEVLEGTEVGGVLKIPKHKVKDWKSLLLVIIKAICNNNDDIVVFLWDELPYMLQKINEHEIARGGIENSSLQIMDTFRALRQEHKNLRMVFTGSIGLHHVLNSLTKEIYMSEPVNNMEKVELEPLDNASAKEMVKFHLEKEDKLHGVEEAIIENIAYQCDYVPFYIEKLIRRLSIHDQPVSQKLVDDEILCILTDGNDDWELEHFRACLSSYYKGEIIDTNDRKVKKSVIAKSILNHSAAISTPQSIDQCYQSVKSDYNIDDRDLIIELLKNLVKDHYLKRDRQGNYQFYFTLIQRWWVLAEGLTDYSRIKPQENDDA